MKRLLSIVLVVGAAGAAHAEPLRINNSFTPHPLIVPEIRVKFDDVRIYNLGYKKCDPGSGSFTTKEPVLTFEITEPMPDLYVQFENKNGGDSGQPAVIANPDGTYYCSDKGGVWAKDWKRGTYKVFFYGYSIGGGSAIKFEIPSRAKADIDRTLAALPTVAIGADGATNPTWPIIAATTSADSLDAGVTCRKGRLMPLAKLDVKRASHWFLDLADAEEFLVTADGKCADPENAGELAAGTHVLWTVVKHDGTGPARYALEADDRDQPFAFPAADHKPLGALDEAMTIAGTVRAPERHPSRSRCGGMAQQPDFYLTSDRVLQNVSISLLWAKQPQRLHMFGPLDDPKSNTWIRCGDDDDGPRKFDVFEGTYAVWIGPGAEGYKKRDDKAVVGTEFHLLVRRDGVAVDPMTPLAPIPTELTLAEKKLENHYPFFDAKQLDDLTAAFTRAPDQLFVYAKVEVKGTDTPIVPGEPLLVGWSNSDKTSVRRWDGGYGTIDTRLVLADRPATIVLPDKKALDPEHQSPVEDRGPEDDKPYAAFKKIDDKYNDCFYTYMEKNDPTWRHGGELYKISGGGRVTNVGDQAAKRANSKCGLSKRDAAKDKLDKTLFKNRQVRWQKHLAAVRTRFGL